MIVNTTSQTTLILNNVTIKSSTTAGIAQIGSGTLVLKILSGSSVALEDAKGASTDYDACIYSAGHLKIEGSGSLSVTGQQSEGEGIATEANDMTINGNVTIKVVSADDGLNAGGEGGLITISGGFLTIQAGGDGIDSNKNLRITGGTVYSMGSSAGGDAGIDTDDGYSIEGGTVVALGSDMLETPQTSSTQITLCFNLDSRISSGTIVSVTDRSGKMVVSFKALEEFSTLIISTSTLKAGTYKLYSGGRVSGSLWNNFYPTSSTLSGGTAITANSASEFTVTSSSTVFSFGKSKSGGGGGSSSGGGGGSAPGGSPPSHTQSLLQ